jgi:large subunit ribosomal protein L23
MVKSGDILLKALISEKATTLHEKADCYPFKVAKSANKMQIKMAVEGAFSVKVRDVTTANVKGKNKKLGRFEGRRPDWKKAYVWLKPGDKIELFESV